MKEYIEREAALAVTCNRCPLEKCIEDECAEYTMLMKIPAADVVEVVLCKDCNYRVPISEQHYLYRGKTAMHCILHSRLCRENDFCSYGERKDGVTDTNVGKMDGKGEGE